TTEAQVLVDVGNAFAWTNQLLRFTQSNRYWVNVGFGCMGGAATGVVGAALASKGKAVAIVGDGALLMSNEISTAVQYQAKTVWIVLNDSCYGMIEQGMQALGFSHSDHEIPSTDFVLIAKGMGADGLRVTSEMELECALTAAMAAPGPFLLDVQIERNR